MEPHEDLPPSRLRGPKARAVLRAMGQEVRAHRLTLVVWLGLLGLGLLLLFPSMAYFPPGIPWGEHVACEMGPAAVSESVNTPNGAGASPYQGNGSFMTNEYDYVFSSGDLVISDFQSDDTAAPGGGIVYYAEGVGADNGTEFAGGSPANWTIFPTFNRTVLGSGPDGPCTTAFVAQFDGFFGGSMTSWELLGPGNRSDNGGSVPAENYSVPGGLFAELGDLDFVPPVLPAGFNVSQQISPGITTFYLSNNSAVVVSCAPIDYSYGMATGFGSGGWVSLPIGIPFLWHGVPRVAWGSLEWSGGPVSWDPTLTYQVSGPGIWWVDSNSATMNGFLTFSYQSCP